MYVYFLGIVFSNFRKFVNLQGLKNDFVDLRVASNASTSHFLRTLRFQAFLESLFHFLTDLLNFQPHALDLAKKSDLFPSLLQKMPLHPHLAKLRRFRQIMKSLRYFLYFAVVLPLVFGGYRYFTRQTITDCVDHQKKKRNYFQIANCTRPCCSEGFK